MLAGEELNGGDQQKHQSPYEHAEAPLVVVPKGPGHSQFSFPLACAIDGAVAAQPH
jgi:hypothetical protein